jgi:hypothetical protein
MTAITNRIAYYVHDRAQLYSELDVLNEARREGTYWKIFGAQGVAQIYKQVVDAINAVGANTRTYTNEYNVFQYSTDPDTNAIDPYANWYRKNVEQLNSQGFGQVVSGIGVQYSIDPRTTIGTNNVHSAGRMEQVLQNLSIEGLPLTLTEFSVQPSPGGTVTTEAQSAQLYSEALRMMYGTPDATSFLIWEPWPTPTVNTNNTTIVDNNWNLRQSGQTLVYLLNNWTTPTQNLTVGADGTVNFSGYYGDYVVTIGNKSFPLSLVKGTPTYSLEVAPGDYNGDGVVDAADYTIWRDTLGSTTDLRADGNGDHVIDSGDYDVWTSAFGTTYSFGSGSGSRGDRAVPEPSGLALLGIGSVGLLACVLRRKTRQPTEIVS